MRRSETTITDTFLESLDAIGVIEYYKFDAHDEEPRLGADWEWWIGSDADGWRCARIQAKRAKHYAPATSDVTPAYSELKHKVNGQLQIDVLISSCDKGLKPDGTTDRHLSEVIKPYYAFYNGWPASVYPHTDDVTALSANESSIAAHASQRTDRPEWGDWAHIRRLHHHSCPHCIWYCCCWPGDDCGHDSRCPVPLPEFTSALLPYWGISTLPARNVRTTYLGTTPRLKALPYFAQSLPISTILFDLWAPLDDPAGGNSIERLPDYADAVRGLGEPDTRDDNLGRLAEFSTGDQRFGVHVVMVTDNTRDQQENL
ncbi:hypothetical protein BJF87_22590 [Gordonia sp. CNJ-863]|nr:hypothetical protein BJF87_22590 [Gordonia sp. CNJ-863]